MDERIKALTDLAAAAKDLGARVRNANTEAEKRLKDAGLSTTDTIGPSIRFNHEFNGFRRAMACDELARLCESAKEETDYLKANFSKWQPGDGGAIKSKDHMIEARARSFRSTIDFTLHRKDDLRLQLQGK
jgi:hypothetical protein